MASRGHSALHAVIVAIIEMASAVQLWASAAGKAVQSAKKGRLLKSASGRACAVPGATAKRSPTTPYMTTEAFIQTAKARSGGTASRSLHGHGARPPDRSVRIRSTPPDGLGHSRTGQAARFAAQALPESPDCARRVRGGTDRDRPSAMHEDPDTRLQLRGSEALDDAELASLAERLGVGAAELEQVVAYLMQTEPTPCP